jgi:hypothetical protein
MGLHKSVLPETQKNQKHRIYWCLLRLVFLPKWKAGSAPYRDRPRTLDDLVKKLWDWFKVNPTTPFGRLYAQDSRLVGGDKGWELAA